MKPGCMTDQEWAEWQLPILGRPPSGYPCYDCPAAFAAEQRAAGTCDGEPRETGGRRRLTYPTTVARERRRAQWREYNRRRRERMRAA